MSKILEEKKNDLITRAEELVKIAETRELTDDEAQELTNIHDEFKKTNEKLATEAEMRAILEDEAVAKNDNVPKEEEKVDDKEMEKRTLEQREADDRKAFEAYIRGTLNERS